MLCKRSWFAWTLLACVPVNTLAQESKPDFPPIEEVTKGYEKVVSTADGKQSFYTIWIREKDGQMLAELPKDFATQRHFIALTIASGERYAGLQAGDKYVYWKQYDKRLALIEPNVEVRSTGDQESKDSVKRLFTDRVILDVPIVTYVPRGGPVIDMDQLLLNQADKFFGSKVRGINPNLAKIQKAKAFPQNVELAFEVPVNDGRLQTLHYSFSLIPNNPSYKPRLADARVGFFTTAYSDLGKFRDDETRVRYINRWHLEKADPNLRISPPKEPIVFYIEHTTPIRYRRWVRQGVLYWNKAFEKIGISDAIEVRYQDAKAEPHLSHMEKDPEDVRYNFIRWLNNDVGTAIGPSRVNPLTGQILDADIILTDGWIRHFWQQFNEIMPQLATEGFSAETLAWLAQHPSWDPRVRLAAPAQREYIRSTIARQATLPFSGHELANVDSTLIGDDPFDGLVGRTSQINGMCQAANLKGFELAFARMTLALAADVLRAEAKEDPQKEEEKKDEEKKEPEKKKEESLIDGMPEEFIGPLLAELVAHEVGHTLGLRHNFKGSSIYSFDEINGEKLKGVKPHAGSVMDYLPVNMNIEGGKVQGDYTMIGIGPYDMWAIEYGYTFENDLKPILARVSEPELQYATDEDTSGPDPLARRYDFSKNPLDYAKEQMRLVKYHRQRLIDKFVETGESWAKARRGYELTLAIQTRTLSMMANWLGGAFVHRDRKGDKGDRLPIEVVPAEQQREAMKFVAENAFVDEAFGLTPDLLVRMSVDKWLDGDGFHSALREEATWPVHDRIMGIQASTLTMLMNPTTLRRVHDNEYRVPADQDVVTLPEILGLLSDAIWMELLKEPDRKAKYTAREPMISSLRRNLQREHLERLIDLSMPGSNFVAAYKPISNLAMMQLRELESRITNALTQTSGRIDPYTAAHLTDAQKQIKKALDAEFIYNAKDFRGGGMPQIIILNDEEEAKQPRR